MVIFLRIDAVSVLGEILDPGIERRMCLDRERYNVSTEDVLRISTD